MDVTGLTRAVAAAGSRYHRLLLIVSSDAGHRSALLHAFAGDAGAPLVNVSMMVSESLLPLPRADRVAEVGLLLDRLIGDSGMSVRMTTYRDLISFDPIESVVQLREANARDKAESLVRSFVVSDRMSILPTWRRSSGSLRLKSARF